MSRGASKREVVFLFSPLSVGSPLKTQRRLTIIIPSILLPKASLAGNFYPAFSQVKSPYSPGLMETKKSHPGEREGRKNSGEEGGKELTPCRHAAV